VPPYLVCLHRTAGLPHPYTIWGGLVLPLTVS
jgi:hypothetical protein